MKNLADWLKGSIPGIIILGAIGSVVAVYALSGVKWLLQRFFYTYFAQHLRPYVYAKILTQRFINRKETESFIFFCVFAVVGMFASWCIATALVFACFYSYFTVGVSYSYGQIAILSITLVALHLACKDAFAMAAIWSVLMQDVHKDLQKLLKKPGLVYRAYGLVEEKSMPKNVEETKVVEKGANPSLEPTPPVAQEPHQP